MHKAILEGFFPLLILVLSNSLFCCLILLLFSFLSKVFSSLTGLSSLLGPLGFWHLALPVGVCSLECNNNNNDNCWCRVKCYRYLSGRATDCSSFVCILVVHIVPSGLSCVAPTKMQISFLPALILALTLQQMHFKC